MAKKDEKLLGVTKVPVKGIRICFDTSQNERGKLAENYTTFKELVEKIGYIAESNLEFPITFRQLSHYDIVFFACPDRSKIRDFEVKELTRYVKCGGGLVVLASSGGDKGRMTNLNDLCSKFGIKFNNDQVFDDQHNYGIRNLAISTSFEDHPITEGLELVIIPSSCSLLVSNKAKGIIFSDEDAEPQNTPVIAISEHGFGRVVVVGSYDTFRDGIRAGIQVIQHRMMLENLLRWIVNDKPLAQILFALSLLKMRIKKAAKKAPPLYSSTLPTTKGRVSPEALLDQIITNLEQVRSVGAKLEDINVHLVEVAMTIKKLNEKLTSAEDLRDELKNIRKDLVISALDKKLNSLDKKFSTFSKKIEKSLDKISKNLEKA
ncbi:MAG: hypothetical protein HWN66_19975 [Candidatus Helarchaeota archaeon]|nr:hypothetical protein [Candidatus Helarchaeota archaeon]